MKAAVFKQYSPLPAPLMLVNNPKIPKTDRTDPLTRFSYMIRERFSLEADKADEAAIIQSISRGIEFRGVNLWTLIFAIFIASIGLNVNSTAVIIGAMLISPLMGPIMGIGLGIGINDLTLIQRALKNLGIAVFISLLTSTVYFFSSPLHIAQSELLARTSPTVWDAFIAFFGGLAGIVVGIAPGQSDQRDSGCSHCDSPDAAPLYGGLWTGNRKPVLFRGCLLPVYYQ